MAWAPHSCSVPEEHPRPLTESPLTLARAWQPCIMWPLSSLRSVSGSPGNPSGWYDMRIVIINGDIAILPVILEPQSQQISHRLSSWLLRTLPPKHPPPAKGLSRPFSVLIHRKGNKILGLCLWFPTFLLQVSNKNGACQCWLSSWVRPVHGIALWRKFLKCRIRLEPPRWHGHVIPSTAGQTLFTPMHPTLASYHSKGSVSTFLSQWAKQPLQAHGVLHEADVSSLKSVRADELHTHLCPRAQLQSRKTLSLWAQVQHILFKRFLGR